MRINPDRVLLPSYIAFVLFVAVSAPMLVFSGAIDLTRWYLVILFLCGPVMCFIGYIRWIPHGPVIPMFLLLLMGKAFALSLLGVAFLFSAINSAPVEVTAELLGVYASFGVAGATTFYAGVYVLLAGFIYPHWIGRSVPKPWKLR